MLYRRVGYKKYLTTHLGISSDTYTIQNEKELKNLKQMFEVSASFKKITPVLHHSFRHAQSVTSDLDTIKRVLPNVYYIQLNDLSNNHSKILQYAISKGYGVILPLNTKQASLLNNKTKLLQTIRDNNVIVLIDNSKGSGEKESLKTYINLIKKYMDKGVKNIAVAGGFNPNNLQTYFKLRNYFNYQMSINAESGLKQNNSISFYKVKAYLHQLIQCV